jgi:hypothetical protein
MLSVSSASVEREKGQPAPAVVSEWTTNPTKAVRVRMKSVFFNMA